MTNKTHLATHYLGLNLPGPIIVGSSRLTATVDAVKACAVAGAGAVVLKSLFQEQIMAEADRVIAASESTHHHSAAADYISGYEAENAVGEYLRLIEGAKQAVSIPVIPSIHCASSAGWVDFARRAESAGADALELNIFVSPADPVHTGADNEKVYLDVLAAVKKQVSIPVALKVGSFFSSLAESLTRLGIRGADGLVLFNRFYQPDLDIDNFQVVAGPPLSTPEEIGLPLRTIAQLSGNMPCDLCASTGVVDGAGAIKMLLVGAAAVQAVSVFYREGIERLGGMNDEIRAWMAAHDFETIDRFRGRMRQEGWPHGAAYDRVQFMRRAVEGRA